MKTQIKPMIWFLTLLALFSAPHLASAYYDPGVQRWINRDPLGDYAFFRGYSRGKSWESKQRIRAEGLQYTYGFVHNSPFQFMDINGLEGGTTYLPDGGMKPPIDNVPGSACVQELQNAVDLILGNSGIGGYPVANADDSLQHCITSCRISRACGRLTAWALGQLKEANDLIHGGSATETDKDLEANEFGRQGVKCKDKSCEDYCGNNRDKYR